MNEIEYKYLFNIAGLEKAKILNQQRLSELKGLITIPEKLEMASVLSQDIDDTLNILINKQISTKEEFELHRRTLITANNSLFYQIVTPQSEVKIKRKTFSTLWHFTSQINYLACENHIKEELSLWGLWLFCCVLLVFAIGIFQFSIQNWPYAAEIQTGSLIVILFVSIGLYFLVRSCMPYNISYKLKIKYVYRARFRKYWRNYSSAFASDQIMKQVLTNGLSGRTVPQSIDMSGLREAEKRAGTSARHARILVLPLKRSIQRCTASSNPQR